MATLRRFVCLSIAVILATSLTAEAGKYRPIVLVTEAGVFQADVDDTGKPQPWRPIAVDVVFQGKPTTPDTPGGGGGGPGEPVPPTTPGVAEVAAISKALLNSKDEATAVAAIVHTLSGLGISGKDFGEALDLAGGIADRQLKAGGRITKWVADSIRVTTDSAVLMAGLKLAWGVDAATMAAVDAEMANPGSTASAIDLAAILEILKMVMELLRLLNFI